MPIIQCVPDSMHTVKDVLERIFGLLTGKENTEKSRIAEEALGRFTAACSSTPTSLGKRKRSAANEATPHYCLTKDQLKVADERALRILTPTHVDFKPGAMFLKPAYMNWKQVHGTPV